MINIIYSKNTSLGNYLNSIYLLSEGAIQLDSLGIITFIKGIFSSRIGTAIFLIEIILFVADIVFYTIIYKHLVQVNKSVEDQSFEPFEDLIARYENLIKKSSNHVNTQSYIEAYFSKYKIFERINTPLINIMHIIQMTIPVFILMGVLGTFTGLTVSLNSLKMGDISIDITKIGPILSGMGVAFNASVVGITFSLILTVATKVFNAEQLLISIMSKLENYMDNKIRSNYSKELYGEVTAAVERLSNSTQHSIDEMKESICLCLNDTKETFAKVINSLSESNNKTVEALNYNINKVAEESKEAIVLYTNNMASSNSKAINELTSNVNIVMNESIEVIKEVYDSVQGLYTFSQQFEHATSYINNFNEQLKLSVESFQGLFKNFSDFISVFNKGINDFDKKLEFLGSCVDDIKRQQRKVDQSYGSIFDKLGKLSDDFYASLKDLNYVQKTFLEQIKSSYDDSNKRYLEQMEGLNNNLKLMSDKFTNSMTSNIKELDSYTEKQKNNIDDVISNFEAIIEERFDKILNSVSGIQMEFIKEFKSSYDEIGLKYISEVSDFNVILKVFSDKFTNNISKNILKLSQLFEKEKEFISGMSEKYGNVLQYCDNINGEYIKQTKLVNNSFNSMGENFKDLSLYFKYMEKQQEEVLDGYNAINSNMEEIRDYLTSQSEGQSRIYSEIENSVKEYFEEHENMLSNNITQLTNSINEQNNLINSLAATITNLNGSISENKKQNTTESLSE